MDCNPILQWLYLNIFHKFKRKLCRKRHRSIDTDTWCKRAKIHLSPKGGAFSKKKSSTE